MRETAAAKLSSKRWRVLNSWWILPSLLSMGILGWLGFLVAAIRTRRRVYWLSAALYALLIIPPLTPFMQDEKNQTSNLGLVFVVICWVMPAVQAAIMNRDYLRTLAVQSSWYEEGINGNSGDAPTSTRAASDSSPATEAPLLGVDRGEFYAGEHAQGSQPAPPPRPLEDAGPRRDSRGPSPMSARGGTAAGRVAVGTATAEQLESLPGVDPALATRIVAVRDARGGYRDFEDLVAAAGLQPHQMVRLRDRLSFDPATSRSAENDMGQNRGGGRILDI